MRYPDAHHGQQWAGAARRARWALAALAAIGCGAGTEQIGGPTEPVGETPAAMVARLVVAGRTERGGTITITGRDGTDSLPGGQLRLAVAPADAATLEADGTIRLLRTGSLTIGATFPDGRVVTTICTVVAPPVLVFDLVVDDNRDIYAVALDGGDLRRLTNDAADDASPSAARGTVVFSSYRTGQGDLYAMPLAGGEPRRLTATSEPDATPALSTDGRRLAFVRPSRGVERIWVADADGTGALRLTSDGPDNAGAPEGTPRWGAGAVLAYTSTDGGQADVAVAAATALPAAPVRLASNAATAPDVEPAWSVDGTRIVFVSTRDGVPALYVAEAGGFTATRLSMPGVSVSQPTWLSDGRIAFVSQRPTGATLVWIDPMIPAELHEIRVPGQRPGHPAAMR